MFFDNRTNVLYNPASLIDRGVGDMAEILEGEGVGIALDDFSPESLRVGVERLLELVANADIPQRCNAVAERYFSLESGVAKYADLYARLWGK
jgi:glycosyltransferase involved in cell wall biosynthesis